MNLKEVYFDRMVEDIKSYLGDNPKEDNLDYFISRAEDIGLGNIAHFFVTEIYGEDKNPYAGVAKDVIRFGKESNVVEKNSVWKNTVNGLCAVITWVSDENVIWIDENKNTGMLNLDNFIKMWVRVG